MQFTPSLVFSGFPRRLLLRGVVLHHCDSPQASLVSDLIDKKYTVYCKDDMSDLIELCTYYLTEEEARLEIENNAARYFDENLHYTRFSAHYLKVAMSELLPSN